MKDKVNFFCIGPPKSASTWIYRVLKEHPGSSVPVSDTVDYFTINFNRGEDWYHDQFSEVLSEDEMFGDCTPHYLHSPEAPGRIHDYNPEAQIICCLRNPVDRAFSHYWHEKERGWISYEFSDLREIYDLYRNWIEPGFYARWLKNYYDLFPDSNIKVLLLDDLIADEREFLESLLEFLGLDTDFTPSFIGNRVNRAGYRRDLAGKIYTVWIKFVARFINIFGLHGKLDWARNSRPYRFVRDFLRDRDEYDRGIEPELRRELVELYEPYNRELEDLIDRDLSDWY